MKKIIDLLSVIHLIQSCEKKADEESAPDTSLILQKTIGGSSEDYGTQQLHEVKEAIKPLEMITESIK